MYTKYEVCMFKGSFTCSEPEKWAFRIFSDNFCPTRWEEIRNGQNCGLHWTDRISTTIPEKVIAAAKMGTEPMGIANR